MRPPRTTRATGVVRPLMVDGIAALRSSASQFGHQASARKEALLGECASRALLDADALLAYHDCLLFLLAYPGSAHLLALARRELARVAVAARVLSESGNARTRARLANSGVAWAPMTIAFGYDIARWLAQNHPRSGDIDSFDDAGASLADLLRHALPTLEFELLSDDGAGSDEVLARACEGYRGSRLRWLVAQLEQMHCEQALREQLFDSLKAYITIRPGASSLSRTFVRGLPVRTYFQRAVMKRVTDPLAVLAERLAAPQALSRSQRRYLLEAGRAMLTSLGRETDAISAAAPEGIEHHELGRGVAIALYTMVPGRRGSLDSHVGFMLFRNSVPVGYGGGWPFLGAAKIGVNIFAPYRGGESAWLFCQVLRVYRHRFGVDHFIAEPSQFGGGNREGLTSGAFWFYYRLGFRPVLPALAALAADEYGAILRNPDYRAPLTVLRRFTRSDIELRVHEDAPVPSPCDAADLSLAVSSWIATRFRGDRNAAIAYAARKVTRALRARGITAWPPAERAAFHSYCLLLAQIPDLATWPARDKARVVALARAKGADEYRYYDLLRTHARLHAALREIAARNR
jgi:hypothetical protein